jgi:hypothetical protein
MLVHHPIVSERGRKSIGIVESFLLTTTFRAPIVLVSFSDPAPAPWVAHRSSDRPTPGGQT